MVTIPRALMAGECQLADRLLSMLDNPRLYPSHSANQVGEEKTQPNWMYILPGRKQSLSNHTYRQWAVEHRNEDQTSTQGRFAL